LRPRNPAGVSVNPARSADLTGQSPGPVMWVTAHGDERSERMADLTCVKLVIDAQAAAFPPVASWRATTSVPSADQCRHSGGLAQFSHEVLRKATHNAITLWRDHSGAVRAEFGDRHVLGTIKGSDMRCYREDIQVGAQV
jgi:hypothetical protein